VYEIDYKYKNNAQYVQVNILLAVGGCKLYNVQILTY